MKREIRSAYLRNVRGINLVDFSFVVLTIRLASWFGLAGLVQLGDPFGCTCLGARPSFVAIARD